MRGVHVYFLKGVRPRAFPALSVGRWQRTLQFGELSLCSHPLTRAALPPVPTGVHETPGDSVG